MYAITVVDKRGYEFEDQEEVYGMVWREEMEGRNIVIKVQSQKQTEK